MTQKTPGLTKATDNAEENGFLGSSTYIGSQRSSNNQLLNVMYFKNSDYVHNYVGGALHRDAWNWWNKIAPTHPHLMISHELYQVPKGYWESIYKQGAPIGVADTLHPVTLKSGGKEEKVWMSPVVDACKGVLKSSVGRMGRSSSEKESSGMI